MIGLRQASDGEQSAVASNLATNFFSFFLSFLSFFLSSLDLPLEGLDFPLHLLTDLFHARIALRLDLDQLGLNLQLCLGLFVTVSSNKRSREGVVNWGYRHGLY